MSTPQFAVLPPHCLIYPSSARSAMQVYRGTLVDQVFVIVLANFSGPFDITNYIARYILQEAVPLFPRVDIVRKAIEESQICLRRLRDLNKRMLNLIQFSLHALQRRGALQLGSH